MSHTSDVRVTPLLEDADTERYHGQKAPPGSVSLKEKPSLGSTEQIHSFTPASPSSTAPLLLYRVLRNLY